MGKKIDIRKVMPSCCKSCVLHPDIKKRIDLKEGRLAEIQANALKGINQMCHNSPGANTIICRGVRNYQLEIFYRLGIIKAETDEALYEQVDKYNQKSK